MFDMNIGVHGGVAFVGDYIPEMLPDVLDRTIQPGKVFDPRTPAFRGRLRLSGSHGPAQGHPSPAAPLIARRADSQNEYEDQQDQREEGGLVNSSLGPDRLQVARLELR
jgi:hypothetical protein